MPAWMRDGMAGSNRIISPALKESIATEARYELARRYYADYVQLVHAGRWKRARHLDLVCRELENIMSGTTKRLMIFMPPRHGKSMTVTETFPSFFLGKHPEKRVIEISYSGELAQQFGKSNRDKVEEYGPSLFGHTTSRVQATKTNWNIDNGTGGMISVGIGGSITGYGADLLIIDDPIKNRAEAESLSYRNKLWDEYQSTVSTRLHAGGAVIIILTRWHEDDLAARLLNPEYGKVEDWKIISLTAICEDPVTDPLHRSIGEALWPAVVTTKCGPPSRRRRWAPTPGPRSICRRPPPAPAVCSSGTGGSGGRCCRPACSTSSSPGTAPSRTRMSRTMWSAKSGPGRGRTATWLTRCVAA